MNFKEFNDFVLALSALLWEAGYEHYSIGQALRLGLDLGLVSDREDWEVRRTTGATFLTGRLTLNPEEGEGLDIEADAAA